MKRIIHFLSLLAVISLCLGAALGIDSTRARRAHVRANPACVVCGLKSIHGWRCEAHHVKPEHLYPALAADPSNFVTLCRAHHWLVGHGSISWSYENTNIWLTINGIHAVMKATTEGGSE